MGEVGSEAKSSAVKMNSILGRDSFLPKEVKAR